MEVRPGNELTITKGGLIISAYLKSDRAYPFPAYPVVYFTFGIGGDIGANVDFVLESAKYYDPIFGVEGDINFDFSVNGGIGAGLRSLLSIEFGLEGKCENTLNLPFETLKDSFSSMLSANVYFSRSVLGYDEKFSKTFAEYQLYPRGTNDPEVIACLDFANANANENEILANLDDLSNLKITPRDYCESDVSLFSNESDSEYTTLKTNVYPYTDVKTVTLEDGRKLTVWLDDDTERSIYNKTSLYYSIYNNGTWSEAKQIHNDGTADFDFSLAVCGNKAAVLFQNMTESVTESDTVESSALKSDLYYTEFETDEWSAPIKITDDNSDYEYNPELYLGKESAHIMWIQNNKNTPSPATDTTLEAVYTVSVTNGIIGDITLDADNLGLITCSLITENNRIYAIDSDNDISTEGSAIYINGEKVCTCDYTVSDLIYCNDYLYFNANGSLYCTQRGLDYIWEEVQGEYKDARIINDSMIIFEKENGLTSELWAATREYNAFKEPVPLIRLDKKIRSWDVSINDNGDFEFTIAAAKITPSSDSESFSQNVSILYINKPNSSAKAVADIELIGLETSGIQRTRGATFNLTVKNNSTEDIDGEYVNVIIKAGETELYNDSQQLTADSGKTDTIAVNVPIPQDFTKQEITATIKFANEGIAESNLENNVISDVIGYTDLSVDAQMIAEDNEVMITIENIGCEKSENTAITLKTNSGTEIYTQNIGNLDISEKRTIYVPIDEEYRTFESRYGKTVFVAEVCCDNDEANYSDNISSCTLKSNEKQIIMLSSSDVNLMPEQQYTPTITVSPSSNDIKFFCFSSDENVATVDENGTITAVGIGMATVTYTSSNVLVPGILTVTVSETGETSETSSEFFEYSDDSDGIVITGFIEDGFDGTNVRIPDTINDTDVVGIDSYAFSDCEKIESISIGKNISFIHAGAFSDMPSCKEIAVDEDNQYFSSENGNLYDKDKTVFMSYATGKTDASFEFPSGVETIYYEALRGSTLETITIPSTVTEINNGALSGALSLKTVSVDENNETFTSIDGIIFDKNKTKLYLYPCKKQGLKYTVPDGVESIADQAFYKCCFLKEIVLPDSVTDIDGFAFFNCNSLKKINLPSGISQIKNYTFAYCMALESIIIPNTITDIADSAFTNCTSLTDVLYDGTKDEWNEINISSGNDNLKNAKIHLQFTVTDISENKKTFSVKPVNITNECIIILSLYDNQKLVEAKIKNYTVTDKTVLFNTDKTYSEAKIMVLKSLNDLNPMCKEERIVDYQTN